MIDQTANSFKIKRGNVKPRTNLSHHPSIFESTDEHRDHLSDLSNRKRQTIDSEPVTEPKKAKIVIPKQEDTILNVFKSDLEKQAYKELLDPRKSKFESNFHATKAIEHKHNIKGSLEDENDNKIKQEQTISELQQNVEIGEDADYNQVPVSDFGMGMLLGMGWSKHTGIGKTFKQHTESTVAKARPRGLGLGAKLEDRDNSTLFAIGDYVKVVEGECKNTKGVVTSMDVEKVLITIQTKSGRHVVVSELSCEKYDRNSGEQPKSKKSKESTENNRYHNDKNKINLPTAESENLKKEKLNSYERVNPAFLVTDITVRNVDESSEDYKNKFVVRTVLTPYLALLSNGREVHQINLESVIPKKVNSRVAIIKGKFKGCVGLMNEKNKKKEYVVLDFWDNLSNHHVEKFGFDDVSEYNG